MRTYPYYRIKLDGQENYFFRLRKKLDYSNVHLINILGVFCSRLLYYPQNFNKKKFVERFLYDWADRENIYTFTGDTDNSFLNDYTNPIYREFKMEVTNMSEVATKHDIKVGLQDNVLLYLHDYHIFYEYDTPNGINPTSIKYMHLDSTSFKKTFNDDTEYYICKTLINFLLGDKINFNDSIKNLYITIGIFPLSDSEQITSNRTELIYAFYWKCIEESIKYECSNINECTELTIHQKYEDCYDKPYIYNNLREILYHDIDKIKIKEMFDSKIVLESETITMKFLIENTSKIEKEDFKARQKHLLKDKPNHNELITNLEVYRKYSEETKIFSTEDENITDNDEKIIVLYYILLKIYISFIYIENEVFYIKNPDGYGGAGISIIINDAKFNEIECKKLGDVFWTIPVTPRRDFNKGQKNKVFNDIELILEAMGRGTCGMFPYYTFNRSDQDNERQLMSDSLEETFATARVTDCIPHKFSNMFNPTSTSKLNNLFYINKAPSKFRISYIIHVTSTTISSIMPDLIQTEFLLPFKDKELLTKAVYCNDKTGEKIESEDISKTRFISNYQSYKKENTLANHVFRSGQTNYPICINDNEFNEMHKLNIYLHKGFKEYFKVNIPKNDYIGMYQIDVVKVEDVSKKVSKFDDLQTCNYKVIDINFSGKMLQADIPYFYLSFLAQSRTDSFFGKNEIFKYDRAAEILKYDRAEYENIIVDTTFINMKRRTTNVSCVKSNFTLVGGSLNKTKLKNKIKKYQNKIKNYK